MIKIISIFLLIQGTSWRPLLAKTPIQYKKTHFAQAYHDKEKTKPVYTEKHIAYYQDQKIIRSTNHYFDLSGKKIAELNSDYTKSLVMPTYIFQDFRNGSKEGLRWQNGKYIIFRQKKGKAEEVTELSDMNNIFSCQGWHYYLIDNLNHIEENELYMNLIFPSKLDFYKFKIHVLYTNSTEIKLRLEFDNWIIRLFAPHLDLTYNRSQKKLINFYGPSNILDSNENIQNVFIYYN